MYDELTEVDIKKMQEEINYRDPGPASSADRGGADGPGAFGDLSENYEYKCAKQAKNRNDSRHPLPGADDPHCQGHRGEGPG